MERTLSPIDIGGAAARVLARLKDESEKPSEADAKRDADNDKNHVAHEASPC